MLIYLQDSTTGNRKYSGHLKRKCFRVSSSVLGEPAGENGREERFPEESSRLAVCHLPLQQQEDVITCQAPTACHWSLDGSRKTQL